MSLAYCATVNRNEHLESLLVPFSDQIGPMKVLKKYFHFNGKGLIFLFGSFTNNNKMHELVTSI